MLGLILQISTSPASEAGAVDFTWLFIKMMGALIVVCILAVVVLRYAAPRLGLFRKFAGGKFISVIARHSLDQKKHLYIIKVGSRYMLLGSSDHGVNLISELRSDDVEKSPPL